jgi:hypothetical protein
MSWARDLILIMAAGFSLMACQRPLHGDTTFKTVEKGFDPEMTPAQREAAIKELQAKTDKQ